MSRSASRWRVPAAAVGAILLHAAFAAWLVLSARAPPSDAARPDVEVSLSPSPATQPAPVEALSAPPRLRADASRTALRPQAATTAPRPARSASPAGVASRSPQPSPGAAEVPAPRTDSFDADAAARRAIAALFACHPEDGGPPDEASRKRCDSTRLAQAHALPHIDGVPAEKRAAYDLQAAADERRRLRMEGPMYDPVVRCTGAGSNFGTGCLPPDAIIHIRSH